MAAKFYSYVFFISILAGTCKGPKRSEERQNEQKQPTQLTASALLGNSEYTAISYGGYRKTSREIQPTLAELKEDLGILDAMNIRILRTYNLQLEQTTNLLKAIQELQQENADFKMYVMLGAWIECKDAWTAQPNHHQESDQNRSEILRAIALAKQYPEIVKIISVGNEAMVKWAESYYVQPSVILKWVEYLQDLKENDELPKTLWITSSDNFASWGGGSDDYHTEDLNQLIEAVDYISVHTYPMHDTYYNPVFWFSEEGTSKIENVNRLMLRAKAYAVSQYESVVRYVESLGLEKPIHIGETGWASFSNERYGHQGTRAVDEYKQALYYKHIRTWTTQAKLSCFYFEAFDEQWKDPTNPGGSENHFGLFTIDGKAKYALWHLVDQGVFKGLTRGGNSIRKTFDGNKNQLLLEVETPGGAVE